MISSMSAMEISETARCSESTTHESSPISLSVEVWYLNNYQWPMVKEKQANKVFGM